jgi:hypothetical protein
MRRTLVFCTLALAVGLGGCYHTIIETGRQPSGQTIEIPWATSFVSGLVPIPTVEAASECPNGVARVETYHSFLNMLATIVTSGIYSPMTIEVACAGGGMGGAADADADVIEVPGDAGLQARIQAINYAAWRSDQLKHPVYVSYGD